MNKQGLQETRKSNIKSSANNKNVAFFYVKNRYISFSESNYGIIPKQTGENSVVKCFTWKNQNNIEVSVITYGARIISMKLPNRAGFADDIALGFDNLNGYVNYSDLYVGSTIGRTTNKIQNATYVAEGKQFWLTKNSRNDHFNGGFNGFDKVNWVPYVKGCKLTLSKIFKDQEDGYPGDLFVQISFELTTKCEFKIIITAKTSKTCPIDITNQFYFNLAGHEKGEEELEKHVVLLNSNCYTPMQENCLPTGEIMNVVNTKFDFQTPKLLRDAFGNDLEKGYNQNFCVNRGVDQEEAFVARVTHPFTGRILEIYSNQYGLQFSTADHFGNGQVDIPVSLLKIPEELIRENKNIFTIIHKLQEYLEQTLKMTTEEAVPIVRNLIEKLMSSNFENTSEVSLGAVDFCISAILQPLEVQLLDAIKKAAQTVTSNMNFLQICHIIDDIISEQSKSVDLDTKLSGFEFVQDIISRQISDEDKRNAKKHLENKSENKVMTSYCKIEGKGGAIYRRNCGICLRTQNYPNAVHCKAFPSPLITPDQTYKHTITYKFWVQTGNPKRWLSRIKAEANPCMQI